MKHRQELVFLFDVDNTLLDNDQVQNELFRHLVRCCGPQARTRYREIYEELRKELGYADYLGALERYRMENLRDTSLLRMSNWMVDYPFKKRLYPHALQVVARLKRWGRVVILSDGDAVFQPRKIERSGLWKAFAGNVLIYIHKEEMLADVEALYPATHYVMIDDKLRILDAMKKVWGDRLTTVFPRQGHYARDKKALSGYRPADISVARIGDLLKYQKSDFLGK
jgi:FMN phosphatase YigB (HAD superfamily)